METAEINFSTILLSYNRVHLLKKTIDSYLSTISVPFEMFIVDNASSDDSAKYIKEISEKNKSIHPILLEENIGGEAFNLGIKQAKAPLIHLTENDIEYLPGWDIEILEKFRVFPKLGQLSGFSPFPQREKGEIWGNKKFSEILSKDGKKIYLTDVNVATTCVIKKNLIDRGLAMETRKTRIDTYCRFPADYEFSKAIRELGYLTAWNDNYLVFNLGHNIKEWKANPEYYVENKKAKPQEGGIEEMKKVLREYGYDLILLDGKYKIIDLPEME